jgi:pyruvate/2-oxoglutarate dehydrogenase complex dihydrolipoamide acyltransferase (E2) component
MTDLGYQGGVKETSKPVPLSQDQTSMGANSPHRVKMSGMRQLIAERLMESRVPAEIVS